MNEKKVKKIIFKNLNNIDSESKKLAKLYGINYIPTSTLEEIIKLSKPSTDTELESVNDFNKKFCNTLDAMYNTCKDSAKRMNSKNVPIPLISKCINEIKKAFN